jgi:regulator of cell morphogenesis and NO signaling
MVISHEKTVGELAAEVPAAARIFEKHHIDYCCGGKHPVEAACRERGIALEALVDELEQASTPQLKADDCRWDEASLRDLMGHILFRHHSYLRSELPRIAELFAKVITAHSEREPALFQVREIFTMLREELDDHMMKEELILFPVIGKLEVAALKGVASPCGSITPPIASLESEHESAGRALLQIRHLTHDYTLPEEACNTYRAMFSALIELEADLHQHIHLENNILFPRAAKLQAR